MLSPSSRPSSRRGVLGLLSASVVAPCLPPRLALAAPALTPACGQTLTPPEVEGPFFKPQSPDRSDLATTVGEGLPLVLTGRVLDACGRPVAGALLDIWQADAAGAYDNRGFVLRGHQFTDAGGDYRLRTVAPRWYTMAMGGLPPHDGLGRTGPPHFGPPPFSPPPGPPGSKGERLARLGPSRGPPGGGLRTPHIHIKLQAPGGPLLTTQLFLPGDLILYGRKLQPLNLQDGLFRPDLVIQTVAASVGVQGRFDFLISTAS